MAIPTVQHIADVSFKNHFLAEETGNAANGKITVNHNTFNVTFDGDRVRAKFASGTFFTNLFRSGTLSRFTQTLQGQYDAWRTEQAQIAAEREAEQARIAAEREAELARTLGFKDNDNAPKVAAVADDFKAVLEQTNPPNKDELLNRLNIISTLATLRNTLTKNPSGEACDAAVRDKGFLTHFGDNTKKLDEKGKKGYVLNMLDTIINGFLEAASQMTDKKVQVVDFLRNFDGACVEAKSDNIQQWLARAAGIVHAARSDSSNDLAYSINAEFQAIADEVRKPFVDEARASCEADIRAECAKNGITDEEAIKGKIDTKVESILMGKDGEISPKIREALVKKGKFCLYEALGGAMRPVTEIAKNADTGVWTVTTLVDNEGKPILKPVSAYDIDKNFDKMVEMYMEDAYLMVMVENKTAVGEADYATRGDYRMEGVLAKMDEFRSGKADVAELTQLVKAEIPYDTGLTDEELQAKVEQGLDVLAGTRQENEAQTKSAFNNFVNFYADGNYLDKKDDLGRLVHLLARHTETITDQKKMFEARIKGVSARCAQMFANHFTGYRVNVLKLQKEIENTLKMMVNHAFGPNLNAKPTRDAIMLFKYIMPNGVFFTDSPAYDIGHRAAGKAEVMLGGLCKALMKGLQYFSRVMPGSYMSKMKG